MRKLTHGCSAVLDAVQRRLDHFALLLQRMDRLVGLGRVEIVGFELIEQPTALAQELCLVDVSSAQEW